MKLVKKAIDQLKPADYNPRILCDKGYAGLKKSLERFGYVDPIIWNKRTGNVIGGHKRLEILKEQGETHVQVIMLDIPLEEEKALNVTLNNPYIQGEFDMPKMEALLPEIEEFVGKMMFNELRLDELKIDDDFVRPKHEKIVDVFQDEKDKNKEALGGKDECWFYVEYYGESKKYKKLWKMLEKLGLINDPTRPRSKMLDAEAFYKFIEKHS